MSDKTNFLQDLQGFYLNSLITDHSISVLSLRLDSVQIDSQLIVIISLGKLRADFPAAPVTSSHSTVRKNMMADVNGAKGCLLGFYLSQT